MNINPDANVNDLLENWKNGNRKEVLDALENDHPGLVAMFLVIGIGDKRIDRADANTIVNLLMDRRIELGRSL